MLWGLGLTVSFVVGFVVVPGSTNMVTANAQLLVIFAHGNHNYAWLSIKAVKPIERGQEVLINYRSRYQYPSHYGPALL